MHQYQIILAAIDCSENSLKVIERAASLAAAGAELHLIHVIEPLALAYGADMPMDMSDLQSTLVDRARGTVMAYAEQQQVPQDRVHVELGAIERTIQSKADVLEADIIVVGCHTRSGLALLLGSTARGIVPGARCDVLAVKVDCQQDDSDCG